MTIAVNQNYKYAELCSIFNEQQKTGNARKAQLNRWKRFIDWVKPTTQIYRITEVFEKPKEVTDGRKNNGGARNGAGARLKMQEEFEYILYCYIALWSQRFSGMPKAGGNFNEIRFTNKDITEYFGLRSKNFSKGYNDVTISSEAFGRVSKKIAEIRQNWIFDKIKKVQGIELSSGIIAYIDKKEDEYVYRDDLLEEWNKHQEDYCKMKECCSIGDIIDKGLWLDMIEYISSKFPQYDEVIKCKKIIINHLEYMEYDLIECSHIQKIYNKRIVEVLMEYFKKKTAEVDVADEKAVKFKDYVKIIDRYVRIYEDE